MNVLGELTRLKKAVVTVPAAALLKTHALPVAFTAWYNKKGQATFSDIIAFVRRSIWATKYFNDSWFDGDYVKIRRNEWESLIDQLARAG